MSEPVLRLRGVRRDYETGAGEPLKVLKGVDLDVYPGEIVGLIGPSGSGKSSLLHAAGLLERPTAGGVWVCGVNCSEMRDDPRTRIRLAEVGFVYQFHHLIAELDALDNVVLPQMIAGRRRRDAEVRAEQLLASLGLGHRLRHQPAQMSGGEQQRVAIARAMANSPRVILADEPTGNLDPATSQAVFNSFFGLARGEGVAAVIATHNMELARYMDRVFAIENGHLEARELALDA